MWIKEPGFKKKLQMQTWGVHLQSSLSYRVRKLTQIKPNLNQTRQTDRKSSASQASGRVRSRAIIQFGGERSSKDPEISHSVWHKADTAELYLFLVSKKK